MKKRGQEREENGKKKEWVYLCKFKHFACEDCYWCYEEEITPEAINEFKEKIKDPKEKAKLRRLGMDAIRKMEEKMEREEQENKNALNPPSKSIHEVKKRQTMGIVGFDNANCFITKFINNLKSKMP